MSISLLLTALLVFVSPQPPQKNKYSWEDKGSGCDKNWTFCWRGPEDVSDPQVMAWGTRWTTQDKEEHPFEWITEVRCLKNHKLCIVAHNQKVPIGSGTMTNIDLYRIEEWSSYQIRAIAENDLPPGRECEIDTLLLNRVEGSVSMLSAPGPAATTKGCTGFPKPKTVVYKLEIGLPK
jgi:hypothetical protein